MRWIASHKALVIVLSIFLLIVIFFVASWQLQGAGNAVGNVARTAVSFIQKPISNLTDRVSSGIKSKFSDDKLLAENEQLKKEVSDLKLELVTQRLNSEQFKLLEDLSRIFDAKNSPLNYKYQAANVLTLERSGVFNIFTIDAGTECGIVRNSVVLNGDGLIGRVLSSGEGWAKVIAVIDENNNVSFEVEHSGKTSLGVCHGTGDGSLTGNMLDEAGVAVEGDLALTSGIGGIYPAGLVIGKVTKAEFIKGSYLMRVDIRPVINFKGLRKVLVIV